jgi:hypothetical protein
MRRLGRPIEDSRLFDNFRKFPHDRVTIFLLELMDKIPIFSVPRFANYEWAMATNQTLAPTLILSAKSIGQLLWDFVPFGRLVGP